jgi:malonyl-CoA O-methyltransferase
VAPLEAPWLHEEIGSRMEQRLQWIKRRPATWADWDPLRGGRNAHLAIGRRYPEARLFSVDRPARGSLDGIEAQAPVQPMPWWNPSRWLGPSAASAPAILPQSGVDLLWSNMALHNAADPQALIARWHQAVAVDGFLMFSCLGPDSLSELRRMYAELGWPAAGHELTDMHDWGDMLVQAGFAEPVMDMERITLSYGEPERLLQELRGLGRNFHPARHQGLRGRGWKLRLYDEMRNRLPREPQSGRLTLTFEIIYGHAFKPRPRLRVAPETRLSMDDMRSALRQGRG